MFITLDKHAYLRHQLRFLANLLCEPIPAVSVITKVLAPNEDQDKKSNVRGYSITRETDALLIDSLGIHDDRHRTVHRPSSARERDLYPKGTPIRQHRHVFAVSSGDCATLSDRLGVEVTPELLGANLVIDRPDGVPYSLSAIPEGTHCLVAPHDAVEPPRPPIATMVHYALQQGCGVTGATIAAVYGDATLTKRFIEQSTTCRGIVLRVEQPVDPPAAIVPGQRVFFAYSLGVAP